jgi:HlyD family secretion protein
MFKKPDFLSSSSRPNRRWVIIIGAIGMAITAGTAIYSVNQASKPQAGATPSPGSTPIAPNAVSALGRLEPQGALISLAAPSTVQGARVAQMMVNEGDEVRQGQVIAVMDNRQRLEAALAQAEAGVRVAEANLNKSTGGPTGAVPAQQSEVDRLGIQLSGERNTNQATLAKLEAELQGQIGSQAATVARSAAEFRTAEDDFRRFQQLAQAGAISDSELANRRLTMDSAQARLNEAKANENRIVESQRQQINEARATAKRNVDSLQEQIKQARANLTTDKDSATAEVDRAIASRDQAKAELDLAFVRAPSAGQILKINTRAGETIESGKGIVELGQTSQMIVIAEVYESDIGKVKVGQSVDIMSEGNSFSGELKGSVTQLGLKIGRKDVLSTDPAAAVDARVVEVKIRLDAADSKKVSGLTNSNVIVKIFI